MERQQESLIRTRPSKKLASNFVALRQTFLTMDHADFLCARIMEELQRRGHQHLIESEMILKNVQPGTLRRQNAQFFDD